MITFELQQRGVNTTRLLNKDLSWKVTRYSNRAKGGPHEAELEVTGRDLALWELTEILRDKITIRDDTGQPVWWGYISEVEVTALNPSSPTRTKTRVGVGLDSMFNRVAIAYEDIAAEDSAGIRYTTAYASDAFSQSEFGIKEGLFSGASASDSTLAEQARDTLLSRKKYPVPLIDLNVTDESKAIVRCRGWWDTLNWKYCSVPAVLALSFETSNTGFGIGRTGYEQLAQGILVTGGDINLFQLSVYAKKTGAPADNLTISIYTNPDDLTPTTLIQAGSAIAATSVTAAYTWITTTFSPEVTLISGTKYFIVIGRSGAVDDANYVEIGTDSAGGYADGGAVYYTGAAWTATTSDMAFRLYDNDIILTSTQALNIVTNFGQFFVRRISEVSSGVYSESYRDGDATAHFEVEQLLDHGTTNDRRMLATVLIDRQCVIFEEDENTKANYYAIYADGSMIDPYGAKVRRSLAKCGVYANMIDVIPPSVDTTYIGSATRGFIEINEYDAVNNLNIYTWRDELDPMVVGRSLDG